MANCVSATLCFDLQKCRQNLARALEIGNKILSQAADKAEGVEVDRRLEPGEPAETIIRIAQDEDFDLIVMGSRGHGSMKRWLLGSVSDHVAHHIDRSVLLVK